MGAGQSVGADEPVPAVAVHDAQAETSGDGVVVLDRDGAPVGNLQLGRGLVGGADGDALAVQDVVHDLYHLVAGNRRVGAGAGFNIHVGAVQEALVVEEVGVVGPPIGLAAEVFIHLHPAIVLVVLLLGLEKGVGEHGEDLGVGQLSVGHKLVVAHAGNVALVGALGHGVVEPAVLGHVSEVGGGGVGEDGEHAEAHGDGEEQGQNLGILLGHDSLPP